LVPNSNIDLPSDSKRKGIQIAEWFQGGIRVELLQKESQQGAATEQEQEQHPYDINF